MWRSAFLLGVLIVNMGFFAVAISNIVYLRRATREPRIKGGPFVSVIVPARDEELCIERCVTSLLRQDYADYEVIVVDDQSSDETAPIVAALGADPRLRLVSGTPLPEGWYGKQHAMAQGAAVACGDILVFTDADAFHEPDSVSWVVTNLQEHGADFLSGFLRQETVTLGEKLVVPTEYAMMMVVPLASLPRRNSSRLAFAIGQLVAVRRSAFDAVGGFAAISDSMVDDMAMAQEMKSHGFRTMFLDATGVASCRLYTGFRTAFHGTMRSIFGAVGGTTLTVALMTALLLCAIAYPAVALAWLPLSHAATPQPLVLAAGLFVVQWWLTVIDRKAPLVAVLLYPAVFLNLVLMLAVSMVRTGWGPGVEWKGRIVRVRRPTAGSVRPEEEVS